MNVKCMSAVLFTAIVVVVGILSCSPNKNGGPSGDGQASVGVSQIALTDSTIIYKNLDSTTIFYTCGITLDSIDSLVAHTVTTSQVKKYAIINDTLRLEYAMGTPDTLDSSKAVVRYWYNYLRQGAGQGIIGTWKYDVSVSYTVNSGNPTSSEKAVLDSSITRINRNYLGLKEAVATTYEFSSSTLNVRSDFCLAKLYAGIWNSPLYILGYNDALAPADSERYNITISVVGCDKIVMNGNLTKETVTQTMVGGFYEAGSGIMYSSSDTSHHSGIVYTQVTQVSQCPNAYPVWYSSFLSANKKTVLNKHNALSGSQPTYLQRLQIWKQLLSPATGGF